MSKLILTLLILLLNIINSHETNGGNINIEEREENEIHPGTSRKFFIKYEETTFKFNITEKSNLQINIHPINCYIDIKPEENIINRIEHNIYSLQLNSSCNNFSITPLKAKIKGEYIENYNVKICPLIINS